MTLRAVFYEEDDAHAVAGSLRGDGYPAAVERERLMGEDDDEDHPWAVVTDAPAPVVEVLVEAHDGWLDQTTPAEAPLQTGPDAVPLDLPDAPRRVKGHFPRG